MPKKVEIILRDCAKNWVITVNVKCFLSCRSVGRHQVLDQGVETRARVEGDGHDLHEPQRDDNVWRVHEQDVHKNAGN